MSSVTRREEVRANEEDIHPLALFYLFGVSALLATCILNSNLVRRLKLCVFRLKILYVFSRLFICKFKYIKYFLKWQIYLYKNALSYSIDNYKYNK